MTVGAQGQRVLFRQEQFAVHRKRRHHSLLEEEDVGRVEAEGFVFGEERPRGGVVHIAGHDVPGDRLAEIAPMCQELLGEDLEERLVLDRGDGVFAFWSVVAESRSLTTGDEKGGDSATPEKLRAQSSGLLV